VLDAGARGFAFAKHLINEGCSLICLEPDVNIKDPQLKKLHFYNEALHSECGIKTYGAWSSGEGNMVFEPHEYRGDNYSYMQKSEVMCRTIDYYMRRHNIEIFELIKLDIEGSEFAVMTDYIERKQVLTKQFSIEWHYFNDLHNSDHRNFNRQILQDKWWLETYECIKEDPMDSVYVL
jgi:FkbM family methyltransferase